MQRDVAGVGIPGLSVGDHGKAMFKLRGINEFAPGNRHKIRPDADVASAIATIVERDVINPDMMRTGQNTALADGDAIVAGVGYTEIADDHIAHAGDVEVAEQCGIRAEADDGFVRGGGDAANADRALHLN